MLAMTQWILSFSTLTLAVCLPLTPSPSCYESFLSHHRSSFYKFQSIREFLPLSYRAPSFSPHPPSLPHYPSYMVGAIISPSFPGGAPLFVYFATPMRISMDKNLEIVTLTPLSFLSPTLPSLLICPSSPQIDVDENLETANTYSIACVPTVRVYCNEKKLHENFGWNSDRLTRAINVSELVMLVT